MLNIQILSVSAGLTVIISIITALVGAGIALLIFNYYNKKKAIGAKNIVAGANIEATKIIDEAKSEAKQLRKDTMYDLKEEQHRLRNEFDREVKERRLEMSKSEQRLTSKEDVLDKKEIILEKRADAIEESKKLLETREKNINKIEEELKLSHDKMLAELQKVAGMTQDEAKSVLIEEMLNDARRDASVLVKQIEQQAKDEADKKAKEIVGLAIQRCATDHAQEIAVSVVSLPNDEMKGRIIGRVGRNIRALESATGCDLIIDDTPEVVTFSGFDPVRREIAKITLEKLVLDGRIHPARIEEMVDKTKKDIEQLMKEAGESAVYDTGLFGIHNELIRLLGRLKYRTSYGQNVLKHSLEVSHLAGMMAAEIGADVKISKRAGLLHDIGKAVDHEVEGTHVSIGVEIAKRFKESPEVIHCIAAHHGDCEPTTIEAILVQAADGISGGRPGARRESIENYIKRLEKLEEVANSFEGVESSFAIQAGREIRVMVKPENVDDAATVFIAKEIAHKLEAELDYPGQIKVNVIRELRSVEYAK